MLSVRIHAFGGRVKQIYADCKQRAAALASRANSVSGIVWRKAGAIAETAGRGARSAVATVRSERLRERLMAMGAFAGLALVMAASCDYLLSGGPDWNPGAEAAPYRADAFMTLSALPEIPYAPPLPYEEPPALEATPVSYAPAGEALLGGPLKGEGGAIDAAQIVYDHEGPAPFGEYELAVEPSPASPPF